MDDLADFSPVLRIELTEQLFQMFRMLLTLSDARDLAIMRHVGAGGPQVECPARVALLAEYLSLAPLNLRSLLWTAQLAAGALGPGMPSLALAASQASGILELATCRRLSDSEPGVWEHPLRFAVGSSPYGMYAGAAIGNTVRARGVPS